MLDPPLAVRRRNRLFYCTQYCGHGANNGRKSREMKAENDFYYTKVTRETKVYGVPRVEQFRSAGSRLSASGLSSPTTKAMAHAARKTMQLPIRRAC